MIKRERDIPIYCNRYGRSKQMAKKHFFCQSSDISHLHSSEIRFEKQASLAFLQFFFQFDFYISFVLSFTFVNRKEKIVRKWKEKMTGHQFLSKF